MYRLASALALVFVNANTGALDDTPLENETCGGDFGPWLTEVRNEAQAAGVTDGALRLLDSVRRDNRVIKLDRSQRVFSQDWLTFAGRMVNSYRLKTGKSLLAKYEQTFARAEETFGVPGPVIAAFWGLETDYGANQGSFSTLNALATLGHDCRRSELFRPQLIAALRLVDRGHLTPKELVGAWAGELGQTQIMPSDYLEIGTDGDEDGKVHLKNSKPDVIMTSANFLRGLGWRPGEPWLEEVVLPDTLPWEQTGPYNRIAHRQWADWGVLSVSADGPTVDDLPASLILPMGRKGPAFLAYPNFDVYLKWNQSLVYATTAAYLATRLAGAPKVRSGKPDKGLSFEQMKLLQIKLTALGHDVGEVDGILGARTREAVRQEQLRLGLPADAWPTAALASEL